MMLPMLIASACAIGGAIGIAVGHEVVGWIWIAAAVVIWANCFAARAAGREERE